MMLKSIYVILTELLGDSTVYGLSRIFRRKRVFLRLFWLVFVLMGSTNSIYFVWTAINSYFKFEVVTEIESIYEERLF